MKATEKFEKEKSLGLNFGPYSGLPSQVSQSGTRGQPKRGQSGIKIHHDKCFAEGQF